MGCFGSAAAKTDHDDAKKGKQTNKRINQQLQKDKQVYRATHRLLLLGEWRGIHFFKKKFQFFLPSYVLLSSVVAKTPLVRLVTTASPPHSRSTLFLVGARAKYESQSCTKTSLDFGPRWIWDVSIWSPSAIRLCTVQLLLLPSKTFARRDVLNSLKISAISVCYHLSPLCSLSISLWPYNTLLLTLM